MLELVEPSKKKKLLEIGSGSGYLLAIASKLFSSVVGVEVVQGLYERSLKALKAAKAKNVKVLCADGYEGAKEHAPFDAIIVSCSCSKPPQPLLEQLAPGGILVAPVGDTFFQELITFCRLADGSISPISHGAVRFVPLLSPHALG
jgi:protein-L-isoaspartate(D-aspartate) O-methyltransferase